MHPKGGTHHQLGPCTSLDTSSTFCRRSAAVDGDSSRADLLNVKRSGGGHEYFHQGASGEEVCTAIVGHPLHSPNSTLTTGTAKSSMA